MTIPRWLVVALGALCAAVAAVAGFLMLRPTRKPYRPQAAPQTAERARIDRARAEVEAAAEVVYDVAAVEDPDRRAEDIAAAWGRR